MISFPIESLAVGVTPRSLDINPPDYWFWGWLKSKIYQYNSPASIAELKQSQRIIDKCREITPQEFAAAVVHIRVTLSYLVEVGVDIFEDKCL